MTSHLNGPRTTSTGQLLSLKLFTLLLIPDLMANGNFVTKLGP